MSLAQDLPAALDHVYRGCVAAAAVAIGLMSLIVPVGVVLRYVFGVGAQWQMCIRDRSYLISQIRRYGFTSNFLDESCQAVMTHDC